MYESVTPVCLFFGRPLFSPFMRQTGVIKYFEGKQLTKLIYLIKTHLCWTERSFVGWMVEVSGRHPLREPMLCRQHDNSSVFRQLLYGRTLPYFAKLFHLFLPKTRCSFHYSVHSACTDMHSTKNQHTHQNILVPNPLHSTSFVIMEASILSRTRLAFYFIWDDSFSFPAYCFNQRCLTIQLHLATSFAGSARLINRFSA